MWLFVLVFWFSYERTFLLWQCVWREIKILPRNTTRPQHKQTKQQRQSRLANRQAGTVDLTAYQHTCGECGKTINSATKMKMRDKGTQTNVHTETWLRMYILHAHTHSQYHFAEFSAMRGLFFFSFFL